MQPVPSAAPKAGAQREQQVQQIFSEIAPRYDLLNHVLSLNIDRSWRKKAVGRLRWEDDKGGTYLDACAGTFDLALELAGRSDFDGRVVASDFAHPMLVQGTPKIGGVPVSAVCGDSLVLPFPDDSFDGVTVGFGVRNLSDLRRGSWAYTYLPASVKEFPGPDRLGALFTEVGFEDVGWTLVSGGIAAIHYGSA